MDLAVKIANYDIQQQLKEKNVQLHEVAQAIGTTENTIKRWMKSKAILKRLKLVLTGIDLVSKSR